MFIYFSDVQTGRSILFTPRLPQEYTIFMGHILTPDEIKEAYQVDEVRYVDELVESLNSFSNPTLLRLDGVNSDSGNSTRRAAFDGKDFTVISTC